MPLFLTWQYGASVGAALGVVLLIHRAGLRRGLMFPATAATLGCLWLLGIHPKGFLASFGGWLVFIVTLLVAKALVLAAINIHRPDFPVDHGRG